MTGKEKCEELKRIREKIAKENGIDGYEFKPCPNAENCVDGTCPACDQEILDLTEELLKQNKIVAARDLLGHVEVSDTKPKGRQRGERLQGKIKRPDRIVLPGSISIRPNQQNDADKPDNTNNVAKSNKLKEDKSKPSRGLLGFFKKKK